MQQVDINNKIYSNFPILLFNNTHSNIRSSLFHTHNNDPLFTLEEIKSLQIDVKKSFLEDGMIVAEVEFNQLSERVSVSETKYILTDSITNDLQKRILRFHHWLVWDGNNQYCRKCSAPLHKIENSVEKKCKSCNISYFPDSTPAVIVLIRKGSQILMARSPHFAKDMYALIAGFVEMGETAEEAVHREVMEEVGIKIKNIQFFSTQNWPFPGSFMIAFTAEYESGEIKIDPNEIEHADWFNLDKLPKIPTYASISRKLILSIK